MSMLQNQTTKVCMMAGKVQTSNRVINFAQQFGALGTLMWD